MNRKISIIIPIFNCSEYIERCVNSLINQTYENIEILLIDDGSTDNSYLVCLGLAKRDSRIRLFQQKNRGVSSARNYGISKSTGEYIAFVDSDDWVDEDYCLTLINGFKGGVQLSVIGNQQVNDESQVNYEKKDDEYSIITNQKAYKMIFNDKNFFGFPWNKLYLKSIINKIGERPFNEKIYACEDTLFNALYLKECTQIAYNESKLYFYYQRCNSATKKEEFNKRKLTVFDSLDQIEKIYLEDSKDNLVYLYTFYLYNYYLIKILAYHTKVKFKFDKKRLKNKYKTIMKSSLISFKEKLEISIRYFFPKLNDNMHYLKLFLKRRSNK